MPILEVLTHINALPERCFQLTLNVGLPITFTRQTGETIVAGVRSGELKLGDSVTFRARHFGIWQTHQKQAAARNIS
ncbi:SRPBCC family protein [Hymenobacter lapidiphilus]|uniref:hypothetical protein n=1 Tax=Hymenobacter sp. CCM 8763 TaxID=2303334 RepID=UPI00167EF9B3|nr:hypothetical protein [Hymenobacter sp. CCM 8763]